MICYDAYKNLNIFVNQGNLEISSCCLMKTQQESIINFYESPYLSKIRQSWDNGVFPAECHSCQRTEEQNKISRRQGSNEWYKHNKADNKEIELIRVDYWTGDTCNLRCAICGPKHSSAWKQELNLPIELKKSTVNYFWKDLDLNKIRYVHFNGGEPLLSKEHIKFLQAIPDKSAVTVNYNTNGTILPSAELLELWEEFKLVQLDFSIDDIKERFEYQRYPAKWDEVTGNLQWFIDNSPVNCMFGINTSVSILNKDNLDNLDSWLRENFYSNRIGDPVAYNKQPVNGLFAVDSINKASVLRYLNDCDTRRGTNWLKTFPELVGMLTQP